jgi:hypothetical protein
MLLLYPVPVACSSIEPLVLAWSHGRVNADWDSAAAAGLRLLKLVLVRHCKLGGAHILSPVAHRASNSASHMGCFRLWYPERLRRLFPPQLNVVLSQSRAEWIITIKTELIIRVVQH